MGNPYGLTQKGPTYVENMHTWVLYVLFLGKPIWVCPYCPRIGPIRETHMGLPRRVPDNNSLEKRRESHLQCGKFYIM